MQIKEWRSPFDVPPWNRNNLLSLTAPEDSLTVVIKPSYRMLQRETQERVNKYGGRRSQHSTICTNTDTHSGLHTQTYIHGLTPHTHTQAHSMYTLIYPPTHTHTYTYTQLHTHKLRSQRPRQGVLWLQMEIFHFLLFESPTHLPWGNQTGRFPRLTFLWVNPQHWALCFLDKGKTSENVARYVILKHA